MIGFGLGTSTIIKVNLLRISIVTSNTHSLSNTTITIPRSDFYDHRLDSSGCNDRACERKRSYLVVRSVDQRTIYYYPIVRPPKVGFSHHTLRVLCRSRVPFPIPVKGVLEKESVGSLNEDTVRYLRIIRKVRRSLESLLEFHSTCHTFACEK